MQYVLFLMGVSFLLGYFRTMKWQLFLAGLILLYAAIGLCL